MNDMFIAPEGAVQFEVASFYDGSTPKTPFGIWVLPLESRNYIDTGGCNTGYPIIVSSLPQPWRSMTEELMEKRLLKRPSVCKCLGRIIE